MTQHACPTSEHYIHGSAPEEQRRLSRLNDLLNEASLRELGLRGGERILDVGSGLAQFTRAMARAAGPTGRVIGIERDRGPARRGPAGRPPPRAKAQPGRPAGQATPSICHFEPAEWGTFDLVHARYLLEHVADPLAVVRTMARAARPGGRIVLADDDHDILRLWPEPPGLTLLWQAYIRSYDRLGQRPVSSVAAWSRSCTKPVRSRLGTIGCSSAAVRATRHSRISSRIWPESWLGARDVILATAHLTEKTFDQAIAALHELEHPARRSLLVRDVLG